MYSMLKEPKIKSKNVKEKEVLSDITKKIILELRKDGCIFVVHSETTKNEYDYLLEEFINFSQENKVMLINLSPLFKKLKTNNINYNYWPVTNKKEYFNERGHQEISEYILKIIKQIEK